MGVEIEAKIKVDDLAAIARRLKNAGARRVGEHMETNTFFDTSDRDLRRNDKGLRLRANCDVRTKRTEYIVTFKGPRRRGRLKTREELEFAVSDSKQATKVLEALGFSPALSFHKLRQSWLFRGCKVELDTLPYLGEFVEIEGPGEKRIMAARKALGLDRLPLIKEGYAALLSDYLKSHKTKRSRGV